jgi:cytochrome c oxidase subunit 1/cytochrome c oxidase subunit I+III
MPRRIYTYPAGMGWDTTNLVVSAGSALFAAGVLLFLINVAVSLRRGAPAGDNPWDAPTLEWATASPPPPYNFAVIPSVASRHPLWEDRLGEGQARSRLTEGLLLDHGRETIGTSALDAEPNLILEMPTDSLAPALLAAGLAALFASALFKAWWLVGAAGAVCVAALVLWFWPSRRHAGIPETADG